jgi:hypothetical protein
VAKRNPYSRWRRLPPVFRSGEHKLPGYGDEAQRIILYLQGDALDQAEALAEQAGVPTLQEYCAQLLARAIEVERLKHHMADVEAKHGPLRGFNEVTGDPGYLAEWREQSEARESVAAKEQPESAPGGERDNGLTVPVELPDQLALPGDLDTSPPSQGESSADPEQPKLAEPPRIRIEIGQYAIGPPVTERIVAEVLDASAIEVVLSHVGLGRDDPHTFLPSLRRGVPVSPQRVDELMTALRRLETDNQGATLLDRRLSYALHRLAMESQVMLTEAWPGVFDDRMQAAIRGVQEMVERILSGQDIRYYKHQDVPAAESDS